MSALSNQLKQVESTLRDALSTSDEHFVEDGKLLPEREIAVRLGVGRRVVRQVLTRLEGEGRVYRKQGHGTFVREMPNRSTNHLSLSQITSPSDLIETRQLIEPMLAGLAAVRATPREIAEMEVVVERAHTAVDAESYERWDSLFHTKIAESVRNRMLLAVFRLVNSVRSEQQWIRARREVFTPGVSEEMVEQHRAILAAIRDGSSRAASAAMRSHIECAAKRIRYNTE
ncbi:FCD domain-containing protein [Aureimonas altamirensis]|uniref:FadR/GntR family transcriptional regulator n=1 Tax=Aureimonas altamirensis TaxID=370622 RepID=UPI00203745EE|nr:FCD domain-containing protein [Aureimonas altamirensis]